ncbi:MAG: SDR family NAD(P)-dependent oxidoreductase [Actinomycetia bacterium]|nr:SDR family NAD(P)-dependent oxidoreductase [Actinomycetes bacterium]
MREVQGKRVLVTGGAAGIGLAIAESFGTRGAEVVLADLDEVSAHRAAEALRDRGIRATGYRLDVTDVDEVAALRDRVTAELGPIDVLVNNAGTVAGGAFTDVPVEAHQRTLRVNTEGPVVVTHAFLPGLVARPEAHVVTVASVAGWGPAPFGVAYGASKWGAVGFSESLRLELAQLGHRHVGVTVVCPSVVDTGLFEGVPPLKLTRVLTPAEVGEATVHGVLHGRAIVLVPWLSKIAPALQALPRPLYDRTVGLFGGPRMMATWRGHSAADDSTAPLRPTGP